MMWRQIGKSLVLVASSAVAVPYTVAFLCNVLYGWPQTRDKYIRAFHPRKVYALNYTVIQKFLLLKYAALYFKWKHFYNNADRSILAKDLPFGRNDRTLDVYSPFPHNPTDPRPVVIFVYGGAWGSGDKSMYGLLCMQIASKLGVIVCCPNYSLHPQGYVDDMIQDVVDSINWVHENCHTYGGNKEKIMLVGHSAGAHLAAMAILELLHDERIQVPSFKGRQLQFDDKHYLGTNNSADRHEDSSGSSESFALVSENGEQQNMEASGATSTFEVLNDQKSTSGAMEQSSESFAMEVSQTSATVDDSMDITEAPVTTERERKRSGGGDEEEEEEDSGEDDDSVVTVKPKDIERHATLVDLCKSVKAFVGLAGVYNIADHYDHESLRGVEDISSMGRAMYGEDHFDRFSPTYIVKNLGRSISLPRMVLVHGTEDYVVPLSSSTKFGTALSEISSDVIVRVLPECSHHDIMLDLMSSDRKYYDPVMGILMETSMKVF